MTLEEIENAFARRGRPDSVTDLPADPEDCDYEDAIWFAGRDWRDVSVEDWEEHYAAFFFLSAEAFAYFLPSILTVSLRHRAVDLCATDRLESALGHEDRDESLKRFVESRFGILDEQELNIVACFMAWFAETRNETGAEKFVRAHATLEGLRDRKAGS